MFDYISFYIKIYKYSNFAYNKIETEIPDYLNQFSNLKEMYVLINI